MFGAKKYTVACLKINIYYKQINIKCMEQNKEMY